MSYEPAYTCPRCGAKSWNPNDAEHQYCGRCKLFEDPTAKKKMADSKPPEHKYKVAYNIRHLDEGMTKAELQADPEFEGYGGTDSFILVSTILPEDGGRSVQWHSSDAKGENLPPKDIFQAMIFIARRLAINGELDKGREAMCWAIWNAQLNALDLPEQDLEEVRRLFGPGEPH